MGDFHQNGVITTLHNLSQRSLTELENELRSFAHRRPMGLILPCLYSELQGPAIGKIVEELAGADYLSEIVIGIDRADKDQFRHATEFFSRLPQHKRLLWNDGPRLRAIDEQMQSVGLEPKQPGKGRNVWFCMGYMLGSGRSEAVASHDCDIVTYDRSLLARLIYPVAHPSFNYEFCKGYYPRIANQTINGRVSRLLVTPLLQALKKVVGPMEILDYLDSFRYPLSGECSFRRDVLNDLRVPADWGLEVGVLSEMKRNYSLNRLCQVDIADNYDHKHQVLSEQDDEGGLSKMSIDIAKALFRKLATYGIVFSPELFRSLKACYYRCALDLVESYRNDALINGLTLDIHAEEGAVELFSENILKAGQRFLDNPMETPFISSWSRVQSALPNMTEQLVAAVEADTHEFMN